MSILSCNYRGLGVASTVKELKVNCIKYKPQLVFLMETKHCKKKLDVVRRRKFKFDGSVYVDPIGLSRGLAVWWDVSVRVEILFQSKNIIHMAVSEGQFGDVCLISCVYGPPRASQRDVF